MSFIRSAGVTGTRFVRTSLVSRQSRSGAIALFHSSSSCASGKESSLHEEGRGEKAEKLKQEQLQKQKDGKGHWHPELSSDSEEAVKADRGEADPIGDAVGKTQKGPDVGSGKK